MTAALHPSRHEALCAGPFGSGLPACRARPIAADGHPRRERLYLPLTIWFTFLTSWNFRSGLIVMRCSDGSSVARMLDRAVPLSTLSPRGMRQPAIPPEQTGVSD